MTSEAPKTEEELLDLIEASLFEVPLAADEILAVEKSTGINLNRLVTRVKADLENARDWERRAAFAETERRLADERAQAVRAMAGRPLLSAAQARARILALKERLGPSASIEGYKLDKLSEDDLNEIVAELELLLEKNEE